MIEPKSKPETPLRPTDKELIAEVKRTTPLVGDWRLAAFVVAGKYKLWTRYVMALVEENR